MNKDSKSRVDEKSKAFEDERNKLRKELEALRTALNDLKSKNQKTETDLKKNIKSAEDSLADILREYDVQMETKTKELSEEKSNLVKMQEELKERQEYFKKIEEERKRETELEKQWSIKMKRHELEKQKRLEAAKVTLEFLRKMKKFRADRRKAEKKKQKAEKAK
eukprot:TRINITY_DN6471_c0_g1_i1.p2 TRINITY_DN6471_c0_g1~~TRINITY_DN6471_c0_g1_i1.p2  ORF type:complete len:165 (-),score=85.34 TRINITY_DN6471_c0_g1_i1:104-598(-)